MPLRRSDHAYAQARKLRRELTLPEVLLWREVRRRVTGVKFRRQHPVGPFVIDFYCASAKLGFEVDGSAHDMGDRPDRDAARTAFIAEQGIRLVRIPARDVLRSLVDVVEAIAALCRDVA